LFCIHRTPVYQPPPLKFGGVKLRWFKHLSDSHNDPDLSVAWDKFGDAGVTVFWVTMEMYAKEFEHLDKNSDGFLKIGLKNYRRTLRKTFIKVESILNFYQKKSRIFFKIEGDYILFKIPKFIELSDNYSRLREFRKKHNDNKMITPRLHPEVEVEVEEDKEVKKDVNYCQEVFNYWNSKKINIHRVLTEKIKSKINKRFKEHSPEEIKKAIDNYYTVLTNDKYYFKYKWTLENFLGRAGGLPQFVDGSDPLNNFLKNKGESQLFIKKSKPTLPKFNEDKDFVCSHCLRIKHKTELHFDEKGRKLCKFCFGKIPVNKESKEKISNVVAGLSNNMGVK